MVESRAVKKKVKNQNRMVVGILALVAIIGIIIIAVNLSKNDKTASTTGTGAGDSNTVKVYKDDDFSEILVNPKKYIGEKVDISGQVIDSKKVGRIWRLKIYNKPENKDGLSFIESKSALTLKVGNKVRVAGTVKGSSSEIIAKGKVVVPVIEASSVQNISSPPPEDRNGGVRQDKGMM